MTKSRLFGDVEGSGKVSSTEILQPVNGSVASRREIGLSIIVKVSEKNADSGKLPLNVWVEA